MSILNLCDAGEFTEMECDCYVEIYCTSRFGNDELKLNFPTKSERSRKVLASTLGSFTA